MYATCYTNGTCDDLTPLWNTSYGHPFEATAEDPRVFFNKYDGYWYLYYYASGPGQNTVYLR